MARRPARPSKSASAREPEASAPPEATRDRIARVLERCSEDERLVLSLLLIERLTPPEAADALGVAPEQVERLYGSLLHDLRGTLQDPKHRRASRSRLTPIELRKAS